MDNWNRASTRLEHFEREEKIYPADAGELIADVFRACGYPVTETGFVESDHGVDMFLETKLNGEPQRISVEVRYIHEPALESSVRKLLAFRDHVHIHRAIIVSRPGFTPGALRLAEEHGVGLVDLLSPNDLRNWLSKHAPERSLDHLASTIIRGAMKALAKLIGQDPGQLATLEWRDLERMLREVFEGLGFNTKLTRPGKDGGFDLELAVPNHGEKAVYLVEVKHWAHQKPGTVHLNKLVQVTASRQATAGLLLSTSGFTKTLYQGFAKLSAPVRLGDGTKVISLCQAYYRLESAIWTKDKDLEVELLEGTLNPEAAKLKF